MKELAVYNIEAVQMSSSNNVREALKQLQGYNLISKIYQHFRHDVGTPQLLYCRKCMNFDTVETAYACPVASFVVLSIIEKSSCGVIKVNKAYPHNLNCCSDARFSQKHKLNVRNCGKSFDFFSFDVESIIGDTFNGIMSVVQKQLWSGSDEHVGKFIAFKSFFISLHLPCMTPLHNFRCQDQEQS